jgi:hypothetical protein
VQFELCLSLHKANVGGVGLAVELEDYIKVDK